MIGRYYKQILTMSSLVILILLFVIYNLQQENKMYEIYISKDVNNDMNDLVNAIVDNHNIYSEVLETGEITKHQLQLLERNNTHLLKIPQDYDNLAVFQFNRLDTGILFNEVAANASIISGFFSELGGPEMYRILFLDELHDVFIELDENLRGNIEDFKELNNFWLKSVKSNIPGIKEVNGKLEFNKSVHYYFGERSVLDDFWIDLIVDLNKETRSYLYEKEIYNIDQLVSRN
jgi:hypothetical protein